MKKIFLLSLLMLLFVSCDDRIQNEYEIDAEIEDLKVTKNALAKPDFGIPFLSTHGVYTGGRSLCDAEFVGELYHDGVLIEPQIGYRVSVNINLSLNHWLVGDGKYFKAPNGHVIVIDNNGYITNKYTCQ